jgi:hypothetical protein
MRGSGEPRCNNKGNGEFMSEQQTSQPGSAPQPKPTNNTPLILASAGLGANVLSFISTVSGLANAFAGNNVAWVPQLLFVAGIVLAVIALAMGRGQRGVARALAITTLAISGAELVLAIIAIAIFASLLGGLLTTGLNSLSNIH